MGKVGSTAVQEHIGASFHTHTLYGRPPSPAFHKWKYGRLGMALRRITVYPLKRALIRSRSRIRIVTFYRDPKKRNPSMFMHDLPFWLVEYIDHSGVSTRQEDAEFLVSAYDQVFPHDYPMEWIENELARFMGVPAKDLMLGSTNYRIVEKGRYSVFVGRMEALPEIIGNLTEFLGVAGNVSVLPANRGVSKWYGPIYRAFLEHLESRTDIEYSEEFRALNGYSDGAET